MTYHEAQSLLYEGAVCYSSDQILYTTNPKPTKEICHHITTRSVFVSSGPKTTRRIPLQFVHISEALARKTIRDYLLGQIRIYSSRLAAVQNHLEELDAIPSL